MKRAVNPCPLHKLPQLFNSPAREQWTDSTGEAWTLVSRILADLGLTREEAYDELMRAKDKELVKIMCARASLVKTG